MIQYQAVTQYIKLHFIVWISFCNSPKACSVSVVLPCHIGVYILACYLTYKTANPTFFIIGAALFLSDLLTVVSYVWGSGDITSLKTSLLSVRGKTIITFRLSAIETKGNRLGIFLLTATFLFFLGFFETRMIYLSGCHLGFRCNLPTKRHFWLNWASVFVLVI